MYIRNEVRAVGLSDRVKVRILRFWGFTVLRLGLGLGIGLVHLGNPVTVNDS